MGVFEYWVFNQTGLSFYDFRKLDFVRYPELMVREGLKSSEEMLREFFARWLDEKDPTDWAINEAIYDALKEDFCLID